jgi:hypothetical protein
MMSFPDSEVNVITPGSFRRDFCGSFRIVRSIESSELPGLVGLLG